jgi:hypothetical protein
MTTTTRERRRSPAELAEAILAAPIVPRGSAGAEGGDAR